MRLKTYLILISVGTALAWTSFFLVLYMLHPSDIMHRIWFYLTFGLSLFGTLHLILFAWERFRKRAKLSYILVAGSERQAATLSLFLIGLLWLQTTSQLRWWLFLLAILILVVVEYVFLNYEEVV